MYILDHNIKFPPVSKASKEGVLAIGGDLCAERLLLAYKSGIFPWFDDEEPLIWWSPDPRFVLFPKQ
ncbi:MAG: leucyl/phenylalanyl-tRNA--protein transferase, partial [Psychroserpens sp.]